MAPLKSGDSSVPMKPSATGTTHSAPLISAIGPSRPPPSTTSAPMKPSISTSTGAGSLNTTELHAMANPRITATSPSRGIAGRCREAFMVALVVIASRPRLPQ